MRLALAFFFALAGNAAAPTTAIKVDQVGYLPGFAKLALVVAKAPLSQFTVRRVSDGSIAFEGKLAEAVFDADSGDSVQAADFTALRASGEYYLEVPASGRSWRLRIGDEVFARAFYLTTRAFYGQRCGTAVDLGPEFPGYRHPACHLAGAYHASSGMRAPKNNPGGWHDAGDYGRYVVNSGITTATLLWAWEMFGERVGKVSLNLPESGNGVPDLLNEVRWNLDWMLSMQDTDGGVWQKQTSETFPGFVMPEKDNTLSQVIGTGRAPYKSSCATADFAAVGAIAARVYRPFDAAYAEKSLRAARHAWSWLSGNPNVLFKNPTGVSTGEYGDSDCGDERLWAAAELWRTTREPAYESYFLDHFPEYRSTLRDPNPEPWSMMAPMAMWTYVLAGGNNATAKAIREASVEAADEIVARTAHNGYHVSLTAADYVWGSNGVAANYGTQLLVANAFHPDRRYVAAALDNLHYLLGRNTFSLSFVTRLGENPVRHPHHRPSGSGLYDQPWPGLLAGGPNSHRQDDASKALPDMPPAKIYLDQQGSYATNEIAINWNASLVFLLAGVSGAR